MSDRPLVAALRAGWSAALAWTAERLGWKAAYRAFSYLQSALWVVPIAAVVLAIQIASGQLTPRIIATTLLRDRVIKYTVGLNMFTAGS